MKNHNFSDQVCAVRVGLNDNCDEKDMGAPIIMKENDRCVNLNALMLSLHYKIFILVMLSLELMWGSVLATCPRSSRPS